MGEGTSFQPQKSLSLTPRGRWNPRSSQSLGGGPVVSLGQKEISLFGLRMSRGRALLPFSVGVGMEWGLHL